MRSDLMNVHHSIPIKYQSSQHSLSFKEGMRNKMPERHIKNMQIITIFFDVIFTENFGEIKSGERFDSLYVNYQEGTLETYSIGRSMPYNLNFKLSAI